MLNNLHDIDIVVHEAMHMIQGYSGGYTPGWIVEGIADLARDAYGLSNVNWSLQKYRYGRHYTMGYGRFRKIGNL